MLNHSIKLVAFALFAVGFLHAADSLDAVFARIDSAAKTFKGVAADITSTDHNALVNSDDVKTGTVKYLRVKPGQTLVKIEYKNESLSYDGREGKRYTPKTNTVDVFNMADKQNAANQYLALGFGASSADLNASYDVSLAGEEKIAGQPASHLKLIPKSAETRRQIKQADLWYGSNGVVIQQKILNPSGDYTMALYSNVKLGPLSEKDLELKIPKGVTVQKH